MHVSQRENSELDETATQKKRKMQWIELEFRLCVYLRDRGAEKNKRNGQEKKWKWLRGKCVQFMSVPWAQRFFSLVHSMAMCPKYTTYTSTLFFPPNLKPFFVGASAPCNRISVCINCNEMKSKTWFTIFHCCTTALCSQTLMNLPHYQVRRIKDKILR